MLTSLLPFWGSSRFLFPLDCVDFPLNCMLHANNAWINGTALLPNQIMDGDAPLEVKLSIKCCELMSCLQTPRQTTLKIKKKCVFRSWKFSVRRSGSAGTCQYEFFFVDLLVRSQGSPCGICFRQSGTGSGLSPSTRLFSQQSLFHHCSISMYYRRVFLRQARPAGTMPQLRLSFEFSFLIQYLTQSKRVKILTYTIFGLKGKRQLGRRRRKWEDNIRMVLREIWREGVD